MASFDLHRVDTITALATAPAPSALAIIRVSGPKAHAIRQQIFVPRREKQSFFIQTLGEIVHPQSSHEVIDEAMCTAFPGPKSYTGEDSFELSLHGNPYLVGQVLAALESLGCRPAEAGEFTLRAYLTGRMDLSSAEAVHDLVKARSERAARQALIHLQGGLQTQVQALRSVIINVLAELEARLDFPEELLGDSRTLHGLRELSAAEAQLTQLLSSASYGQRQREGARVVLLGRPNVGKSTLLNTLYGEERALVFELPGTTRDVLEVELEIDGYHFLLVDVAGLRTASDVDPVEALGMGRVVDELKRASCVLFLRDCPKDNQLEDEAIRKSIPDHVVVIEVETKADKNQPQLPLAISAVTGVGIEDLKAQLRNQLYEESTNEVLLTRERHRVHVLQSRDATRDAIQAIQNHMPHEIVCGELRRASQGLDDLMGSNISEDVLETIFSRFCIGK
ncbi:MAG: tRNA uridine-5-carboxymethylaminomethyl(34) synthesis GTPase MnmE [Myxococcales bacterium]|nr:tRNA uridine-5-carboxymethylaminomethyl(34) synthesis GTPase MnmE [Myxococcales bacterium]